MGGSGTKGGRNARKCGQGPLDLRGREQTAHARALGRSLDLAGRLDHDEVFPTTDWMGYAPACTPGENACHMMQ